MSSLTLYHGSNAVFDEISLEKSRNRRDFGRGFYTTTVREQASNGLRLCTNGMAAQEKSYMFLSSI